MTTEQVINQLSLLRPGAAVTFEVQTPAGQRIKFRSSYVGFLAKNYVLVQMPDGIKYGNNTPYIKQDAACTLRGLIEGDEGAVIAFVSTIVRTVQLPSKLVVISFPSEVAVQYLRQTTRIKTKVKSALKIAGKPWAGVIQDISVSGCLVEMDNATDMLLKENDDVEIKILDSIANGKMAFQGAVCNLKQKGSFAAVGIKFKQNAEQEVFKLLQKILMNQAS